MRKTWLVLTLACASAISADRPGDTSARLRVAGVFIAGFNVWRTTMDTPRCEATGKPWLKLECGFIKCPKPQILGIPLEIDYTNWRKSPRVTEVEAESGAPLALHLAGSFARGINSSTIARAACAVDVRFMPRAGAMYEVTLDPTEEAMFGATLPEKGQCRLRLSEIKPADNGIHERFPVEGAVISDCIAAASAASANP